MAQDTIVTRTRRGLIICRASEPEPATFVTDYPGAGIDPTLSPIPAPLDITASGLCSESAYTAVVHTAAGKTYVEEPLVIYQTNLDATVGTSGVGAGHLRHAVELQSTGDDLFQVQVRPGLQAAPGADDHRIESVEPFLRRPTQPGTKVIDVRGVTTSLLDVQGGTDTSASSIPALDTAPLPIKGIVDVTAQGRFLGFDLKGTNVNSIIRYMGAVIRGRRIGGSAGFKREDIMPQRPS